MGTRNERLPRFRFDLSLCGCISGQVHLIFRGTHGGECANLVLRPLQKIMCVWGSCPDPKVAPRSELQNEPVEEGFSVHLCRSL